MYMWSISLKWIWKAASKMNYQCAKNILKNIYLTLKPTQNLTGSTLSDW